MSSVATESKIQRAVSLQGVDPETCMIVFKNHWAQVMLAFHPLCWLGRLRGFYWADLWVPTCVTSNQASRNIGRKPFQVGRKANFSSCFPRIGSYLKTLLFVKAITGHECSPDIFGGAAVRLQVTCISLCNTLDREYILFLSLQSLNSNNTIFIKYFPSAVLNTTNALYHLVFSANWQGSQFQLPHFTDEGLETRQLVWGYMTGDSPFKYLDLGPMTPRLVYLTSVRYHFSGLWSLCHLKKEGSQKHLNSLQSYL